jgi:glucokinase
VVQNPFKTLVFDIGGSHASASLVQDDSFALCHIDSCPLNKGASKEELLGSLETLGRKILSQSTIDPALLTGIGFAMPGPFDYESGISYMQHKHESLYGVSVREEMAKRFNIPPQSVVFINDAAGYLLGEISAGAAKDGHRVVGMTLGTGVGSGFAVDGKIVTTGPGVPPGGEIWNVKWGDGIFEDVISTRAIQGTYRSLTGATAEVKEIAEKAFSEPAAAETFRQFATDLGAVMKAICDGFHPDLIVIGGAIARSANLFLPVAQEKLAEPDIQIRISQLFDHAALVGAGAKWLQTVR